MYELLMNLCFFGVPVFVFISIKSCHLSRSEGSYRGFLELRNACSRSRLSL